MTINTRCEAHARQFCNKGPVQVFTEEEWKWCRKRPAFPRDALVLLPTETLRGMKRYRNGIQKCPGTG